MHIRTALLGGRGYRKRPKRLEGQKQFEGHWQEQAGMVRSRADEHVPLPAAGADAVECRDARDLRRCRMPAKHAGFRGRAGARGSRDRRDSGGRGRPDRGRLPGRIIRPRRAGRCGHAIRQPRDPPRQGADRPCRQGRRRGRALRALGRDQPGRHRHRRHARPARRHRRAARRHRPRHRGFRRRWRDSIAIPRSSPAPGCSTRCRCRSG